MWNVDGRCRCRARKASLNHLLKGIDNQDIQTECVQETSSTDVKIMITITIIKVLVVVMMMMMITVFYEKFNDHLKVMIQSSNQYLTPK